MSFLQEIIFRLKALSPYIAAVAIIVILFASEDTFNYWVAALFLVPATISLIYNLIIYNKQRSYRIVGYKASTYDRLANRDLIGERFFQAQLWNGYYILLGVAVIFLFPAS